MPDIFVSDRKEDAPIKSDRFIEHKSHKSSVKNQAVAQPTDPPSLPPVRQSAKPNVPVVDTHLHSLGSEHLRHAMFPLASFALDPKGVYFATQGTSEEVHLFLRRHFATNIPWILASILLLLSPPLILPFLGEAIPFTSNLPLGSAVILLLFYYTIIFGTVIFTNFINWYFNVYIVTNERIIDVDFVNILYREVSGTRLNLIQDVTVKAGGVVRAIFNYGDVFIQTAGTEVNFDFHAVPHPHEVAREIEKLMEEARAKEGKSDLEQAIKR